MDRSIVCPGVSSQCTSLSGGTGFKILLHMSVNTPETASMYDFSKFATMNIVPGNVGVVWG